MNKKIYIVLVWCCLNFLFFRATALTIDFYGHQTSFTFTADFYKQHQTLCEINCTRDLIDRFRADAQLTQFITDADRVAEELKLDDMAFVLLVNKVAKSLAHGDANFEKLFAYAILYTKGYDVLLGKHQSELTLYATTGFEIKNALYVEVNGRNYYDLTFSANKHPQHEELVERNEKPFAKAIQMNRFYPPALHANSKVKSIPFEYDGHVYFFDVTINQSLVSYYHDLPDVDFSQMYLNYGLSGKGKNSLINQLGDATADLSKERALQFILAFVQNMSYATDAEVWGKEKFAFPEESISNEYSDCEDRSMLFAYLVREVLHLQTIGLVYDSHMNVAVENWRKQSGDFSWYDMDFVICEPSGSGLKPGEQTMDVSSARFVRW